MPVNANSHILVRYEYQLESCEELLFCKELLLCTMQKKMTIISKQEKRMLRYRKVSVLEMKPPKSINSLRI